MITIVTVIVLNKPYVTKERIPGNIVSMTD